MQNGQKRIKTYTVYFHLNNIFSVFFNHASYIFNPMNLFQMKFKFKKFALVTADVF